MPRDYGDTMSLTESDYTRMPHGTEAPDFTLPGADGEDHPLQDLKGENATLIIFMCNHCPYVIPRMEEIDRIARDYKDKDVAVVGINPNNAQTHPADSFENMQKLMKEKGYTFHYLRDESQDVAKAYGATCTPDPFLFDKDLKLVFHSRIDNAHGDDQVDKHEMHAAIAELLEKGEVTMKEKPSMGCNIKWK